MNACNGGTAGACDLVSQFCRVLPRFQYHFGSSIQCLCRRFNGQLPGKADEHSRISQGINDDEGISRTGAGEGAQLVKGSNDR